MSDSSTSRVSTKPVIFVSYSHKDEPERTPEGDIPWRTEILSYLAPAANGIFELWTDEEIAGGADWERDIKTKLAACDICILLVSRHSLASRYVIDVEIETILERQRQGHNVQLYPIVLSPFPQAAAPPSLLALNLRPRLDKPLSGFSRHNRAVEISKMGDEIVRILGQKARPVGPEPAPSKPPSYVHINGLPDTPYVRLVGRHAELKRLDEAWADPKTNIISLVAEGGAGKSALVNEWLKGMQAESYCGADAVLGWSFYSQGTKERATSADGFLNWALDKLGIELETTSASAKGEAIAEAMAKRRVLLMLDGVEPLQHGPGPQAGQLKDLGLRALLRRFASVPPAEAHGLIVLTSRLAVADIARFRDGSAQVVDVERLSEEAGAALLRDNGVWGTDKDLKAAARDFGGHPLALGLLASLLKETQLGDVRRRDHIRRLAHDADDPRHDHARRVMESYEKEWIPESRWLRLVLRYFGPLYRPARTERLIMREIMLAVGLFDRPADGKALAAIRRKPRIKGLTDALVDASDDEWLRAVARLREVRLLAPRDPTDRDALDAHPLVREWFGERLRQRNEAAWKAAHGRLYEHLRDTTKEGKTPTLEDLAPLYQAIAHGCCARQHEEALERIYRDRVCRRQPGGRIAFYASQKLGAIGSNLAAISWFFDKPFMTPVAKLKAADQSWVLSEATFYLRAQGRFAEALPAMRALLPMAEEAKAWRNAATRAVNLSEAELLAGEVAAAVAAAEQSVAHADRSGDEFHMLVCRTALADSLHAAGRRDEAARLFVDTDHRQEKLQPEYPLLYSVQGYYYCNLLLSKGDNAVARDRAAQTLAWFEQEYPLLSCALDVLTLGRAHLGLALATVGARRPATEVCDDTRTARARLDQAIDSLRDAGQNDYIPRSLLARAAFRRSLGDWDGAARDLDEVEEIAEPGPMRLFLCDRALERARLAFARIEAFAPLNGMIDGGPPQPVAPEAEEAARLREEARVNLAEARKLIAECGYHRRDEELAELEAVLAGERRFADLPPRV
ncbi:MAG TPA: TIR domain-containing protein [Beijerinckiaceae bacterium]|jgi:hypothetical protein